MEEFGAGKGSAGFGGREAQPVTERMEGSDTSGESWGHSRTPSAAKAPGSGAGAEGKLVCGRCVIHAGSSVSNVLLAFPLSLRISEPSQATASGFGAVWTRLPLTDPAGRFWQVWSQGLSGI